jgi:hypothetical protein
MKKVFSLVALLLCVMGSAFAQNVDVDGAKTIVSFSELEQFFTQNGEASDENAVIDVVYTGDAVVTYRNGVDVWLRDLDQLSEGENVRVYHAKLSNTNSATFGTGDAISNFGILVSGISRYADSSNAENIYYRGMITSLPDKTDIVYGRITAVEDITKEVNAVNDMVVGTNVVTHGKIVDGCINGIKLEQYFPTTDEASAVAEDDTYLWSCAKPIDTLLGYTEELYVAGVVGIDENDNKVLYTISASTDKGIATGVEAVAEVENAEVAAIYNLQGAKMDKANLPAGIYVVLYTNGKAEKICK